MYFFLLIEEFLSRIITNGSWKTALFICSICRSENRSLGRWLKATMQISALGGSKHMGTQVLLALAPKCFWAMVHVNIKSRYTMFLPTVSLFRIRERLFYQEKNQHVLISVSAFFFFFCMNTNAANEVLLSMWLWMTHFLAGKESGKLTISSLATCDVLSRQAIQFTLLSQNSFLEAVTSLSFACYVPTLSL